MSYSLSLLKPPDGIEGRDIDDQELRRYETLRRRRRSYDSRLRAALAAIAAAGFARGCNVSDRHMAPFLAIMGAAGMLVTEASPLEEAVGIPAWKLSSGERQVVGPKECDGALQTWDSLPSQRQRGVIDAVALDVATNDARIGAVIHALSGLEARVKGSQAGVSFRPVVRQLDWADILCIRILWEQWLAFLHLAAEGDGFEVQGETDVAGLF